MKKIIFILSFVMSLFAQEKMTSSQIDNFASELVKEMAKTFPLKFNKYSSIVSAVKLDKELVFTYQTTLTITNEEVESKKYLFDNEWCSEDIPKNILLKNGYKISSVFKDTMGRTIVENVTSYDDCLHAEVVGKYNDFLKGLTDKEFRKFDPGDKQFQSIYSDRIGNIDIDKD